MQIIFLVLPLALLIAAIAVLAFIWAVRTGQLDDLETPALRVLHDDEEAPQRPQRPTNEPREADVSAAALKDEPDEQDHRDPGDADRRGHAQ